MGQGAHGGYQGSGSEAPGYRGPAIAHRVFGGRLGAFYDLCLPATDRPRGVEGRKIKVGLGWGVRRVPED